MASVKQRTNPQIMKQKICKARRLLEEVQQAMLLRDKTHHLWKAAISDITSAIVACGETFNRLEEVTIYNHAREQEKI